MRRLATTLFLCAALGALAFTARPAAAPDWSARLTALDPARPLDYLLLGEEVADRATTREERDLARQLFGLAGALSPEALGRSAALAQAALAEDMRQRRTLLALAALLSAGDESTASGDVGRTRPLPQHAVAFSEAFSQFRRGQGPRALNLLKTPEVGALLDEYGSRLPGGAERFREDCKSFKGGLRPSVDEGQRILMLEIEKAVLGTAVSASERPSPLWSSALVETGGAPLLEVDTAKLESAFGVDPARSVWRKGQWQRPSTPGS